MGGFIMPHAAAHLPRLFVRHYQWQKLHYLAGLAPLQFENRSQFSDLRHETREWRLPEQHNPYFFIARLPRQV